MTIDSTLKVKISIDSYEVCVLCSKMARQAPEAAPPNHDKGLVSLYLQYVCKIE